MTQGSRPDAATPLRAVSAVPGPRSAPVKGNGAAAQAESAAPRGADIPVAADVNSGGRGASNRLVRQAEAEEDRALIDRARTGDKRAFRELVERHQRRAFAIALALVRDENDAREVVQEAFLRVYRGIDSFHGGSSFFTWLYRIVTNLSIDLMRKPARRDQELDESREISDELDIRSWRGSTGPTPRTSYVAARFDDASRARWTRSRRITAASSSCARSRA